MTADPTPSPKLHTTKDGSHTLYSAAFRQYYHNPNGAVSESLHVFFEQNGLMDAIRKNQPLHILEMGFGTGLNFIMLLSMLRQHEHKEAVTFHSIEAYPIDNRTASEIDFGEYFEEPFYRTILKEIFGGLQSGENVFKFDHTQLHLQQAELQEVRLPGQFFDFVFYDPFSPEANPECWTIEAFEKIHLSMKKDGILSTYCAASSARAAIARSGFFIARAQGALGKREMTLASPSAEQLSAHKRLNEQRLIQRWEAGDFS